MWRLVLRRRLSYAREMFQGLQKEEAQLHAQQPFLEFCQQMQKLEAAHRKQMKAMEIRDHELRMAALASGEPLRDTLDVYMKHRETYSAEHLSTCLDFLGKLVQARNAEVYRDLPTNKLWSAWQFEQMIEDLKAGAEGREPMSKWHLVKCLDGLRQMGFKDLETMTKFAQCVLHTQGSTGVLSNEEFQRHLETLRQWKHPGELPFEDSLKPLVEDSMFHKSAQKNLAEALFNLRTEYYALLQAQKHPELKNNPELAEQLVEVEEALVKAGVLSPAEFEDAENFTDINKKMDRAAAVFNDLITNYFPYLKNPLVDAVFDSAKGRFYFSPGTETSLPELDPLTGDLVGHTMLSLARALQKTAFDPENVQFPNHIWENQYKKQASDGLVNKRFTKTYRTVRSQLIELKKRAHSLLDNMNAAGVTALIESLGLANLQCPSTTEQVAARLSSIELTDPELSSRAVFGFALLNSHKKVVHSILAQSNFSQQNFDQALKSLWAACVFNLSEYYQPLSTHLNTFSTSDVQPHLRELLQEIALTFELEAPNIELGFRFNEQLGIAKNSLLNSMPQFDPVKPHLRKICRILMNQGLTEEERDVYYKQLVAHEGQPRFPYDDILAINGQKVPLFFLGEEEMSNGRYELLFRLMRQEEYDPYAVNIDKILNIEYDTGRFSLKEDFSGKSLPNFPTKNYLANLEDFAEALIGLVKSSDNKNRQALETLSNEVLLAFKQQSIARVTVGANQHQKALEELKLQLLKLTETYKNMPKNVKKEVSSLLITTDFVTLVKTVNASIQPTPHESRAFWSGARQRLETLTPSPLSLTKEILNQSFLWSTDYFYYEDWHDLLQSQYSLATDLNLSADDMHNQFYFGGRRQMYGVTPDSKQEVSAMGLPIDGKARFVAALANIKYEIKRNFSDQEIIDKILGLDCLNLLLDSRIYNGAKLVERSAESYVNALKQQYSEKMDVNPYKKYFRQIRALDYTKKSQFKILQHLKNTIFSSNLPPIMKKIQVNKLYAKYQETLRALDSDNPDRHIKRLTNTKQRVDFHTDKESLESPALSLSSDPDYLNAEHASAFLEKKILKAHTTLLKAKLLYKLFTDQPFTSEESKYFQQYLSRLQGASLSEAGSVNMPTALPSLKIKDLPDSDRAFFNSLRKVDLSSFEEHSLSDLLFELSHFIDETFIRKVETSLIEAKILQDWGIQPSPSGISKAFGPLFNKSLWLSSLEQDEQLWRQAGLFTDQDTQHFFEIFGIMRGKDYIDRQYWQLDKESFKDFLEDTNKYDNRLKFIKDWYRRKQAEREETTALPSGPFKATDKDLGEALSKEQLVVWKSTLESQLDMAWDNMNANSLKVMLKLLKDKIVSKRVDQTSIELMQALLSHPNFDPRDKEELTSLTHYYKINIHHDDFLCEKPVPVRGDQIDLTEAVVAAGTNPLPALFTKLINYKSS